MDNSLRWWIFICLSFGLFSFDGSARDWRRTGRDVTESIEFDGTTRTFHVHLPPSFSKREKHPLVIALHGGGGSGKNFDSSTKGTLNKAADERKMVVVYPEGIDKSWNDGRPEKYEENGASRSGPDDVGFISRLIDEMRDTYGIDSRRVYVTGISNGGFMSYRLAMDLSSKIAAVAPVAAQLAWVLRENKPDLPVSVMIINGTADPIVPFDGGAVRLFKGGGSRGKILSTEDTIEKFRAFNGCSGTPSVSEMPDLDPGDGCRATVEKYGKGRAGTEVVLVRVTGGGHAWPGGRQYLPSSVIGTVCQDFSASEVILDFFLKHKR